jgi:hypothetical protein
MLSDQEQQILKNIFLFLICHHLYFCDWKEKVIKFSRNSFLCLHKTSDNKGKIIKELIWQL